MKTFNEEQERLQFKKWAQKEFGEMLEVWLLSYPAKFGHFSDPKVEYSWQGWLSCAKSKFENNGVDQNEN